MTNHAKPGFVGLEATAFGGLSLHKRRIFLTEQGFVGKGPKSLQPGDQIWIFAGSRVPLILRKSGRRPKKQSARIGPKEPNETWTYELVGHAYADGIMHGE